MGSNGSHHLAEVQLHGLCVPVVELEELEVAHRRSLAQTSTLCFVCV